MIATRITKPLLGPVVNMNGMGAVELAALYLDVASALRKVNEAMGAATPHGRDYQTMNAKDYQGQDPATLARAAHNERRQVVLELEREYEDMALFIHRQKDR